MTGRRWKVVKIDGEDVQAESTGLPKGRVRCALNGRKGLAIGEGNSEDDAHSRAMHDWLTRFGQEDNEWWPEPQD
jgi:hypothetical protein